MSLNKVCVFCGGKAGSLPVYMEAAYELGKILAQNNIDLIYGAGGTGLMKAVADGCKKNGGHVVGMTIKRLFNIERPDLMTDTLDELQVYRKLFARKYAMTSAADAFCVLPGGLGTIDEILELMVLKQLGMFDKPIVVLNIAGYFLPFQFILQHMHQQQFMKEADLHLVKVVDKVEDILPAIKTALKKTCENDKT